MSEKQIKFLTTLGKISGILTTIASYAEMIPDKFKIVGVVIVIAASTVKDVLMQLGDLWDDGQINKSNTPK